MTIESEISALTATTQGLLDAVLAQAVIGAIGPQGETGPQGPQGPQGDAGPQGPQGLQGDTGPQGPQGATGASGSNNLQYQSAMLENNIALLVFDTYVTAATVSLTSGKWLVVAYLTHIRTSSNQEWITARLTDGSITYASTQAHHPLNTNAGVSLTISAIIDVTSNMSLSLQGKTSSGATTTFILAATAQGAQAPNATALYAVRIAD